MKKNIKSMTQEELKSEFALLKEPAFRAGQVFKWLHGGVKSFDEMTNISKDLRAKLDEQYFITVPKVLRKQVSAVDGTIKYLWELYDGNSVESVVMSY